MSFVSYLSAIAAHLALAGWALARWRDRPASRLLVLAAVVTAGWAAYLAVEVAREGVTLYAPVAVEIARQGGWLALLTGLIVHFRGGWGVLRREALLRAVLAGGITVAALGALLVLGGAALAPWASLAILATTVAGLVLVEQLYRHTPAQERWAVKLLCLGIGGLFAFEMFLFADLVLFRSVASPTWEARGVVAALITPLLGVALHRLAPRGRAPTVSRQLVLHTAALTGAGLYLIGVGAAGYILRETGGDWGVLLQVALLFGAGLLLGVMLFSGSLRARLRIWVNKHFFHYKYDYRSEWLRFTRTLSAPDGELPFRERAVQAMAELVDSTGGMLWLRDPQGDYRLEAAHNLGEPDPPAEPRGGELARFLAESGWVIDLDEHRHRPERYAGVALPSWLTGCARHWLVVPLFQGGSDGDALIGFVVLARPRAPRAIDWEDRDLLKTAARQVAVYAALVQTSEALVEARQFETFHRLAAFLVHDLKNVSGQLGMVVSNAHRHRDNPAFLDSALQTVGSARERLDRTLAHLRSAQPGQDGLRQRLDLAAVVREAVARCAEQRPVPELDVTAEAAVVGDPERLVTVIAHLVRNAQEATPPDGTVQVRVGRADGEALVEVADTGQGMDERFLRDRLFRPFQTTKGNAGMGIGVYEAREYIARLGGRIDVRSQPGQGTVFALSLAARDEAECGASAASRAAVAQGARGLEMSKEAGT